MKAIIATLILTLTSVTAFGQFHMTANHIDGREFVNTNDTIVFDDIWNFTQMDTLYVYNNSTYVMSFIEDETGVLISVNGYGATAAYGTESTQFTGDSDTITFNVTETNAFYLLEINGSANGRCIVKVVDEHLGINEASKEDVQLNVFPNPVVDYVTVRFNTENNDVPVYVYTLGGQLVYTDETSRFAGANDVKVDFGSFNTGIYLVKVGGSTFKVIKN